MKIKENENFARASLKDVIKYKVKWLMPETAKLTGIGLQKLKQIAREYADFPYIKIGVKHLVIKDKLPDWFEKHKGEEL